jgi:4-hydroxybenzoate polyprenyltransferase|tara:strand:- start:297 stop:1085 length:789 start_codon:yes stop_codon:yes gene_type:complete
MISLLTLVIAHISNVPSPDLWFITLAGMFLAMAGFALDFYTDRDADRMGGRTWPINPLASGSMSPTSARIWIGCFVCVALALCTWVHLLTLIPAAALLLIYWGLAHGVLDGPIGRAITLGLLQALYVLLAVAATGGFQPTMSWVALVLFVAMFGARAFADIRDLPHDVQTGTRSLPKVYGVRITSWIAPIAITIAAGIALFIYTLDEMDVDYLIWTVLAFVPGVVLAWMFKLHPTPNLAFALAWPYWSLGVLYMLALILGST